MRQFEYRRPRTVDEALALLAPHGAGTPDAGAPTPVVPRGAAAQRATGDEVRPRPLRGVQPLAGGTDLVTLMKADVATPSHLVDVKRLADLPRGIQEAASGLNLGALTTLAEIEQSGAVRQPYSALTEAAALAATPQLRNMATIGGNLLQRPRCWYFRHHLFQCWLKGGQDCPARDGENQFHALFGQGPCVAVHPSDPAAALMALQAQVQLRGQRGERRVSMDELFALPEADRRTETTLREDELLLSIHLPPFPAGTRSTYLKAMDRKVWAFALVGVAAVLRCSGRRIEEAHLVLSGVAPIPWRAAGAERLLTGAEAGDELFARAAEAAVAEATPLRRNGYKIPLARSLVRRALSSLATDVAA
ncbi:MAG TPA: FAD binding domain-containing protein [Chloroflexota bacterium]|jgi:xanthine dehydrogenase YagS FAD-binding subunit|nr:FAD binding domain-containing protein [Chloroflexota bacterium]